MTEFQITYETPLADGMRCLVPAGVETPYGHCSGVDTNGQHLETVTEAGGSLRAHVVTGADGVLSLTFHFREVPGGLYPDAIFQPRPSRYTRASGALLAEVAEVAPHLPPAERTRAIACATAERFTYGHPEARFGDGFDAVPALGCGLTEGSCVDINTYFIAALRGAGIEAGYVTGYFFPAEKGDWCTDGHCWVVTRIDGQTQEWDIAHHLKMGSRDIHPGLNPKPGYRAAMGHSMGLSFPELGVHDIKALIEPRILVDGGTRTFDTPIIRLRHPRIAAGTAA